MYNYKSKHWIWKKILIPWLMSTNQYSVLSNQLQNWTRDKAKGNTCRTESVSESDTVTVTLQFFHCHWWGQVPSASGWVFGLQTVKTTSHARCHMHITHREVAPSNRSKPTAVITNDFLSVAFCLLLWICFSTEFDQHLIPPMPTTRLTSLAEKNCIKWHWQKPWPPFGRKMPFAVQTAIFTPPFLWGTVLGFVLGWRDLFLKFSKFFGPVLETDFGLPQVTSKSQPYSDSST